MLLKKIVGLHLLFFRKINIFGLDAPLVIVFWQKLLEREFNLQMNSRFEIILFLSVWLAYSADRFLDNNNIFLKKRLEQRHLIFKNRAFKFCIVWLILFFTAVVLTGFYLKKIEIYYSLVLLLLVILNQALSILENKKLNKTIIKSFRSSIILSLGCIIYPFLHLDYYNISFVFFPIMLCIIFLGNCLAVSKFKLAYFNLTNLESVTINVELMLCSLVLLGMCLLGVTSFTIATLLSISSIPVVFLKSNLCYDDRRVLIDQIFWIIPSTVLYFSFVCKF